MAGLYIKLDVDFWDHPKVLAAGEQAAVLLIHMFSYVTKHRTDGFVPVTQMSRFGLRGVAKRSSKLHEVALILPSNEPEGWLIPSWLERNPSKAEIESIVEKRRSAGTEGAKRRWQVAIDEPKQVAKQDAMTEKCLTVAVAVPVAVAPSSSELTPRAATARADDDDLPSRIWEATGIARPPANDGDRRTIAKALARGWHPDQLLAKAAKASLAERDALAFLRTALTECANTDPPTERTNGPSHSKPVERPRPLLDDERPWCEPCGSSGWVDADDGVERCPACDPMRASA